MQDKSAPPEEGRADTISAIAIPTKEVMKTTTTHPHTALTAPPLAQAIPRLPVIPVCTGRPSAAEDGWVSVLAAGPRHICKQLGSHQDGNDRKGDREVGEKVQAPVQFLRSIPDQLKLSAKVRLSSFGQARSPVCNPAPSFELRGSKRYLQTRVDVKQPAPQTCKRPPTFSRVNERLVGSHFWVHPVDRRLLGEGTLLSDPLAIGAASFHNTVQPRQPL